ncbi:alpha/beta hydrolase [Algoriphagus sediminis]|uniref:Alpha/beta hydrolase family protein n=1 Tax=Algoriphagus sediminis TaxID=3057113 RepID=A0ABT7Y7J7_9BACT|nr:alpha/beta hydrolase family protein [Algoriphagus sediminis]MDN3202509.1 alpha/beta hydrolase family protein [Algoriphagus sediminis]
MKKFQLTLGFFLISLVAFGQFGTDSLPVYSEVMQKTLKAAITYPNSYQEGNSRYPVLYLLHGGSGAFDDWHRKVTEKGLVQRMANEYDLIIVTPGVGPSSYYFDSPLLDSVQYATYMIKELIPFIDSKFRTIAKKESRAITGLSMGGHGAITLAAKNPDLFIAAGSMSGVMNIDTRLWKVPENFRKSRQGQQLAMLGKIQYDAPFSKYTAVGLVPELQKAELALIIDCGVDDFLIETNRQMHKLLLDKKVDHEYIERPGAHTWPYWTEALPVHMVFFDKYLKRN